jgi:hypothetical protein
VNLVVLALVLAAAAATIGCRADSPANRALFALVDRPEEHTTRPHCVLDGPSVLRAGFRYPTWCTVHYAEGNAIWRRDAWGEAVSGGRMWMLGEEDSLRWPHLRDSLMAAVRALAGDVPPCPRDRDVGIGGQYTVWVLPGYSIGVTRYERGSRPGGGYEILVGLSRGTRTCGGDQPSGG